MTNEKINASELQLGDTVTLWTISGSWNTCFVIGVSDEVIELFRPYGHLSDFSCSWSRGGPNGESVIPYIGNETWKESRQCSHKRFTLINRVTLK